MIMPERQKKSKEKFAVKFNEEIETLTKESGNQYLFGNKLICPTFFVDSLDEESEKDNNTKEEINRLLVWASALEPLDEIEIKEVDPNIKEEIIEECTKKIDENNNMKELIKTITKEKYQRKRQIHYTGEITFTNWVEKKRYEEKEKIPKEIVYVFTNKSYNIKQTYKSVRVADPENTIFQEEYLVIMNTRIQMFQVMIFNQKKKKNMYTTMEKPKVKKKNN